MSRFEHPNTDETVLARMVGVGVRGTDNGSTYPPDVVEGTLNAIVQHAEAWVSDPQDVRGIALCGYVRLLMERTGYFSSQEVH